MRPYISPVRSTILALKKSPTQKKKTKIPYRRHRCGAGQIPSEGQVRNILATLECQRGVNYAYLDARGHWRFYSSGVLPPFLVTQVVSLQNSSFKNPKRGGLVILPMLCPILIGPLSHQGFHAKDGLDFLLAHGRRPVRPCLLFLSSSPSKTVR